MKYQSSSHGSPNDVQACLVAQQFRIKKDKARYMIVYGPYQALKAKQRIKINASHNLVSLPMKVWTVINKNVKWMWTFATGMMKKMLLWQPFTILQRPDAVNLIEEILNAIKYLDAKKFLHLGLDEPCKN